MRINRLSMPALLAALLFMAASAAAVDPPSACKGNGTYNCAACSKPITCPAGTVQCMVDCSQYSTSTLTCTAADRTITVNVANRGNIGYQMSPLNKKPDTTYTLQEVIVGADANKHQCVYYFSPFNPLSGPYTPGTPDVFPAIGSLTFCFTEIENIGGLSDPHLRVSGVWDGGEGREWRWREGWVRVTGKAGGRMLAEGVKQQLRGFPMHG